MTTNSQDKRPRLLVLAGPSGAGKSTLMRRLAAGELTETFIRLGLEDVQCWEQHAGPDSLSTQYDLGARRLIIHLDLYGAMTTDFRRDLLRSLLPRFDEVHVLFLCAHYTILKSRASSKLIELLYKHRLMEDVGKARRQLTTGFKRRLFYARSANIQSLYQHFYDLLLDRANVRQQWLMDSSTMDHRAVLPFDWPRLVAILTEQQIPQQSLPSSKVP